MATQVQWRVDPIPARGFGPHQVMVYVASVYLGTCCLDSVVCARRSDARNLAIEMATQHQNVRFARPAGAE